MRILDFLLDHTYLPWVKGVIYDDAYLSLKIILNEKDGECSLLIFHPRDDSFKVLVFVVKVLGLLHFIFTLSNLVKTKYAFLRDF